MDASSPAAVGGELIVVEVNAQRFAVDTMQVYEVGDEASRRPHPARPKMFWVL